MRAWVSIRSRRRAKATPALLAGVALWLAGAASAAVPGQINYQGLLLDSAGVPINGNVNLVLSLFTTATGGSNIFSESFPAVPVQDGVYEVALGSTTPLTPELVEGGTLYLEIDVDGEILTPRQRLLAVPYALRAADTDAVGGFSNAYVSGIFEHFSFDGGPPGNTDPQEGLTDTDGDTVPNFLDDDNDGDGLTDTVEVGQGSDINLVTPTVTGAVPDPTEASVQTTVQFQGTNFEPGMTVQVGVQSPTPTNVTPTSFDVQVGPQTVGTKVVTATRTNGQSGTGTLGFTNLQPSITALVPDTADATTTTVVNVQGQNFVSGIQVNFGSETPTPFNLTQTSFDVSVGPQPEGIVSVVVSYPSGLQDSGSFLFDDPASPKRVFVTLTLKRGNDIAGLEALPPADAVCQASADAESLGGVYLAWLSDGVTAPDDRFSKVGPFALPSGTLIANDWADLTDGTLLHEIDESAAGNGGVTLNPWSNVASDGTNLGSDHCNGWSSNTMGAYGDTTATNAQWTDAASSVCTAFRPLYCFEQ